MDILSFLSNLRKPENPPIIPKLIAQAKELAEKRKIKFQQREKGFYIESGETAEARFEFGGGKDLYNTIIYLDSLQMNYRIIIMSSRTASSMNMGTAWAVLTKKLETKKKWIILDIEGKKGPYPINIGKKREKRPERRRKIIKGRRMKKQD
ncbi:hypothetical protein KAW38_02470 [Candidatus Micrarchaeota archaeon]|nr:hypothetical protein [Candidatus Micrarchaeota archaeon]